MSVDELLEAYDRGEIDRRSVVLALGEAARADIDDSTFAATGLNHVALSVADVAVTRDFLVEHIGAGVVRDEGHRCFLAVGGNHFVGLFRVDPPPPGPGVLNHVCFTIEGYDPDEAERTAREAGLRVRRTEDRVFFWGPDGLVVQVAAEWGDFPLPVPS